MTQATMVACAGHLHSITECERILNFILVGYAKVTTMGHSGGLARP
jgi:hypothetical protein